MGLKSILPLTLLVLSTNYLCSWTYGNGQKNTTVTKDSVTVPASTNYSGMNPVKYVLLGKNYREDWAEPVRMQVFHINKTNGGYTIEKLGGGQQTKSLHIKDKRGEGWVLRTVDKDVTNAVAKAVRNTFIKGIVQDQISAAYPYASLTVTDLARTMDVPTDTAVLYYVPDDEALGSYRPYFANTVCFLRRKNMTKDGSSTYSTQEIKDKLFSSTTYLVMQEEVLRARLLDMLIGDWDRHDKQWEWGIRSEKSMNHVYPIPEDRDQAYFLAKGLIPKIVQTVAMPHFVGFRSSLRTVKDLNNKAYGFDRFFMSGLDADEWRTIIKNVQAKLTDNVINNSVSKLPPEIYDISGKELAEKLISRRNDLEKYGMDYYEFIASEAVIPLTKEKDVIRINETPRQSAEITVETASGRVWFRRLFLKKETRNIKFLNHDELDVVIKNEAAGKSGIKIAYAKPLPPAADSKNQAD